MAKNDLHQRVAAVRRFNRFYTKQIGVLHEGLAGEPVHPDRGAGALRAAPHRDEADGDSSWARNWGWTRAT